MTAAVREPDAPQTPEEIINRVCTERHILQRVCLELTYRCNERCKHCYVGDENKDARGELTAAQYASLLDELRAMDTLHITLTGGDVAMRRDFLEILRGAAERGFAVGIYTNGIGFSPEALDEIARLRPRAVSFSLYSGIPEEHDALTGVAGSFDRTLSALTRLRDAGVLVDVKTAAMRPTEDGFPALVRLCGTLGVELEISYLVCATNRGCLSPTALRLGSVEKYKAMMRRAAGDRKPSRTWERDIDGPVCGAGTLSLSINPYGDVFPCNGYYVRLGNILETPVREIWESDALKAACGLRFRDLGPKCTRCPYRNNCLYCMGAALAENGTVYQPVSESCLISQAAYELRREAGGNGGKL